MMDQKTIKAEELFFVVDENDNPLPPLPRKQVHGHGVWHRVSHIWLRNNSGQFLCQQRSLNKELIPGFWEPFFGGHLGPEESYQDGAVRELREELGIKLKKEDVKLWRVYKMHDPAGYNNEFQGVFVTNWNGDVSDVTFDDGEVEQVAWMGVDEIRRSIIEKGGKGWVNCGYELDLLSQME